ncbi:glycosyltransferase [Hydrogenivirga sp. 128-5-R1-1]|uniref:glycosyltransferase n=1 Tax=Hydrogenivirga sp. 128-5-R1-1 TaxID=392423 RepID=UPI00015F17FA|nr:glycosyltransferase [Hydrogenivirga sp. 128-5-R1-1]EDP76252.1 Cellulose synthase (UDP-forming) [Hydrogenivirga sp. 128-5-R1-1]
MKTEGFRRFLILLSVSVSTYYIVWRLGTLNPDAPLFSAVLYGAEVYGLIASIMFFYMVWRLPNRKTKDPPKDLKVDIFIPTLNESPELLRKTIQGAISVRYPHRTYVLDDGSRREVRELCEELGCRYIPRYTNEHGKAGNLNNALGKTDGDFIAVLDADHVPQPDFLDRTLGYFADEEVAFVQTPQDFYNVDSYQHRLVRGKLWNEQSLFFRVIMRGKDRTNSAFFCGSCAVVRRKALEDIGGFATGTVTEDLHTSIRLHAKGWKSVYYPHVLAYGVAPADLAPFKNQRGRWGEGAMQVFAKENPLLTRGLTLPQRINYFASMSTYLDGFQKAIFYTAPVVVLLTGKLPISVSLKEFLPVFLPHIFLSVWAFEEASRGYGRMALLEQYNMARFFTFMKSLLGFIRLKRPRFMVTEKDNDNRSSIKESLPQTLVLVGSAVGVGYGLSQLLNVPNRGVYAANIFWASLNLGIASTYVAWTTRKRFPRKEYRFPANFPAMVKSWEGNVPVTLEDLHGRGAAIISERRFNSGDELLLTIPFNESELKVEGKVIYSKPCAGGSFFRSGILFKELSPEALSAIETFNFRFLLKKYMEEHDRPSSTPLEVLLKLLNSPRARPRQRRKNMHAPGLLYVEGELIPYTTEDVSDKGMRLLTYREIRAKRVLVKGGNLSKGVRGTIVWGQELYFHGIKAYRYGLKVEDERFYGIAGEDEPISLQRRMA